MADSYNVKKITELAAKSASDDTDLYVVGNQGTATMRKISFATIAAAVRDKLTSLTFPSLNTSNKTLPGAVNELNSKLSPLFKVKTYTYSGTVAANGAFTIDQNMFNASAPSGYTALGIATANTGNADLLLRSINTTGAIAGKNVASVERSFTATLRIAYILSSATQNI